MPLPTPNLDDLRFQKDLVDEARRRIIRYCPEWTDYNVSDPGVTLIELFSWMTEMIVYRLNRVPEKNYIKFLEMIGVRLLPASPARARLTFWLSAPLPFGPEDTTVVTVPCYTEIATSQGETEQQIVFTTDAPLVMLRPPLVQLRQEGDFNKNYLPRLGVEVFYPFSRPRPRMGDTFYLGFDPAQDISGYLLRLVFDCEETQAVGVRREDPPLIWEVSLGNNAWQEVPPSTRFSERDTTGGLNNAHGALVLYLPLEMRPDQVHGRTAYWVRCRLQQRRKEQGMYTESPRVLHVSAYVMGGTTWATHAQLIRNEQLGRSDGEPGQIFHLQHAPVLGCSPDETVEVEEYRDGQEVPVPWQAAPDFSNSDRYDRHFTLDPATGEVAFGPSVRQPDGTVRQYGRVPETGRRIWMRQYRHGGGSVGNVPPGKLQSMLSAIPYIDRVTNLERAGGGRDQESLDEAMLRAQRELRSQQRAVTAEDFENLARAASREVARVRCISPGGTGGSTPGTIQLLVVPSATDALRAGDLAKLQVEQHLQDAIQGYLDQYRLVTAILRVKEPDYLAVKVCATVAATAYSQAEDLAERVREALRAAISPLALSDEAPAVFAEGSWQGWPFGRDLYVSEVYSLIQQVKGVKHVLDVKVSYRPLVPAKEQAQQPADEQPQGIPAQDVLVPVQDRVLKVGACTLLCSLDHEITVVEL